MRRVAWGCGRTGGVAPSTPGRPVDELEADFSPASGSELVWAENAAGAARAQRRCAERAERTAAENGRARRAWVDGDGVPVGHTGRPRNGNEGEGLPDDRRRRSGPRTARGDLDAAANPGSRIPAAGCVAARRGARGVDPWHLSAPRFSAIITGTVGRWWPRAVRRGCRGDPPSAWSRETRRPRPRRADRFGVARRGEVRPEADRFGFGDQQRVFRPVTWRPIRSTATFSIQLGPSCDRCEGTALNCADAAEDGPAR